MRVIMILAGVAAGFVLVLIGLVWVLVLCTPFFIMAGAAVYFIVRSNRRRADMTAFTARETERQRLLNVQEYNAWRSAVDETRRKASRREKALRQFDSTRDPS